MQVEEVQVPRHLFHEWVLSEGRVQDGLPVGLGSFRRAAPPMAAPMMIDLSTAFVTSWGDSPRMSVENRCKV